MRLALALGVAFGALTLTAEAQPDTHERRVFIHASGDHNMDADTDGWITRAEMTAAADRMFGELDRNDDGRLNEADHPPMDDHGDHVVRIERDGGDGGDGERVVRIIRNGEEVHTDHHGADDGERRVERRVDRRVERRVDGDDEVIIMRGGDDGPSWHGHGAMMPPMPPHPPMMMFMSTTSEEFDRNGDGALSAEEFRNQQLRQFDAQDGNGDGRIRAPERFEAPTPPEPPTPPTPPRRH